MKGGPPYSAGDIENFGYCPLSWWLGLAEEGPSTKTGIKRHNALNADLLKAEAAEHRAAEYGSLVLYYAFVSSILTAVAFSLLNFGGKHVLSHILLVLSILWMMIALTLVLLSMKRGFSTTSERILLYLTLAAIIFATLSIVVLNSSLLLSELAMASSLIWLTGASIFLRLQLSEKRSSKRIYELRGIPGEVIYLGDGSHPLLQTSDGLIRGRPDFIVKDGGKIYPVEFKSGRIPQGPLFSHIIQLAAYCKLVEDNYGYRPEAGFIYYMEGNHFEIDYDTGIEQILQQKIEEMIAASMSGSVHRNHNRPGKCLTCSRRGICPEKLS
ncbi:MAG: Dna2/Cas4 domain-containing protein [Methanomassiliicoccales archaeon]